MSYDPHDITISVQALDGAWEVLGTERYRGIVPENVNLTWNDWGPDVCSFVLRRDPGAIHPDLSTWTPIEVMVAGVLTWDGRLKETPTTEGDDPTISVQAEGWQYHLDDDVYSWIYVHSSLTDFVDARSIPTASLNSHPQAFNVTVGDGAIVLGLQKDTSVASGVGGGATLDLGPGNMCNTLTVDLASSFNTAQFTFYAIGHDLADWTNANAGRQDWITGLAMNDASFVSAGNVVTQTTITLGQAKRYCTFLFYNGGVAVPVLGADYWFRIAGARLYAASNYYSVGQSTLKAGLVIKDALARAAPFLATDLTQISAGTFSIPEFAMSGSHSPREVINAANAYENFEVKVLVGRRLYFAPRVIAPKYEIGGWSGADFQDASANSGDEIYNHVVVQGTGPDGTPLAVDRYETGALYTTGYTQLINPTADVNNLNWTVTVGTFTRDATVFDTGPASFRLTANVNGQISITSDTAPHPLKVGKRYRLSMRIRSTANLGAGPLTTTGAVFVGIIDPAANFIAGTSSTRLPSAFTVGSFITVNIDWTQAYDLPGGFQLNVVVTAAASVDIIYLDSIQFGRVVGTLPGRRDFQRTKILPVSTSITTTSGNRIGDLYLAAHKTTPFKGGFQAVGTGGVRRVLGGGSVHPAHLNTGELVRCAHRIDPDTGGWGRDGTIAAINYNHDALTSSVSLDENRAGLETLLGRLAVVQGQRRA